MDSSIMTTLTGEINLLKSSSPLVLEEDWDLHLVARSWNTIVGIRESQF